MRMYVVILLSSLISGYSTYDDSESSTDLPIIISETEIARDNNGHCTFAIKKRKIVSVPIQYSDVETFYGRCPGYYFKKCLRERNVIKTRYENQVHEINETVSKCCEGFVKNADKCKPVCEHECIYGICSAPNECSCYEGYSKTDVAHECEPNCVGCTYGKCIAPLICLCDAGYEWDSTTKECVPVCTGLCHNGKCLFPEKCECDDGYIHHPTHSVCIPYCKNKCINGVCIGSDKCECDFGYQFKNGTQHECEPICELSCKNAKCISPNICECHNGYTVLNDEKQHECHCGLYCVEIGNECHCLDDDHRLNGDVIRNNMSTICTESNCQNGTCISYYECDCHTGFIRDDNFNCVAANETCIDDSENCMENKEKTCDCINGICDSNNACICVNGFEQSSDHSRICEPSCKTKCVNGFCINPDECHCESGYRLSYNENESHICHPICDPEVEDENGCVNGTCIAPGTCECYESYKFSNESNFICIFDENYQSQAFKTSKIKWLIPAIVVTIFIVLSILGIHYFKNQRKAQIYNANHSYDEANEPIAGYVNNEL